MASHWNIWAIGLDLQRGTSIAKYVFYELGVGYRVAKGEETRKEAR